ncbi:hypothetical protein ACFSC6_08650 [Rufibacter sediminis]|uniref:STAS/SEC14 domain-containing protein n=1 Tax=Rufibacter sediminis TaxID=2762756 RepID=A0ABR6VYL1_9BACT|nr:hypothetical protein [Rufibacter sediminis]MBC3542040.1 hypothetical protein [Rufibacter sediminis]
MRRECKNSFNKTFYVVEHSQELDIVDTLWYGYASPTDLRQAMEAGLEVLEQTNCAYKLNDNTQFTGPWKEAVKWLEKEWLPRAMKAGLCCLAHVANADSLAEESGKAMEISLIGRKLIYRMFHSRTEALAWLKTCQVEKVCVEQ